MTGEHTYEMFTKASTQKMWPAGVKVYSSESQSSLSFSMLLNSFVTPFSASSSYWNLVSPFLNSGKKRWTVMLVTCSGWFEVGDLSTCTMGVGLVTSTRQNSFEGCIKIMPRCIPGFCSKGIPWHIGSFWNWQPDKCIILHHHLYILLKNKERTLNFTFRSGLRRLWRLLDNGNFDVIFDVRVCARCWITPLWVRP